MAQWYADAEQRVMDDIRRESAVLNGGVWRVVRHAGPPVDFLDEDDAINHMIADRDAYKLLWVSASRGGVDP